MPLCFGGQLQQAAGDPYHGAGGRITGAAGRRGAEGSSKPTSAPRSIPLAIWLGKDTHQAAYPGDHGIHFAPIPGAVVTTPQVTEGDKVLWPLIDEEPVREPQPV